MKPATETFVVGTAQAAGQPTRNGARDRMPEISEPRFHADLLLRVFGMDAGGHAFSQNAHACDISDHGAKLTGLEKLLAPGDIIGVQFGDKKARCKVMWAADAGPVQKIEAGVKVMEGQPCPWQKERINQRTDATTPIPRSAPAVPDKRKFPRHRVFFPIEVADGQSVGIGMHMQTHTADVCGNGCYVETMIPLPVKKLLNVSFWLNSERIHTTAIVRTSDGGVGMGIEFTGLDETTQQQLQEQIETLALEAAPLRRAKAAF